MDKIFTHRSGAQLWQGSVEDVITFLRGYHPNITVIGLFAQEFQDLHSHDDYYELIKGGFDDSHLLGDGELNKVIEIANHASDLFSDRLRAGKGCLSSCAMGLNRSGLVSALTLMKVHGMAPEAAIQLIRKRRPPQQGLAPLSNPKFVEIIHSLAPKAGSKATFTEWNSVHR